VKTKILTVIFIGGFGIFLGGAGISLLLHCHSFTETAQAVVLVREEKHVMVRVERNPPAQEEFQIISARRVSLTEQTENLKVGDKLEVFHPPGQPDNFLVAHEFSYVKPIIFAGIGVVLFAGAAVTLLVPSLRKSL
jgi:hypothetical protein